MLFLDFFLVIFIDTEGLKNSEAQGLVHLNGPACALQVETNL